MITAATAAAIERYTMVNNCLLFHVVLIHTQELYHANIIYVSFLVADLLDLVRKMLDDNRLVQVAVVRLKYHWCLLSGPATMSVRRDPHPHLGKVESCEGI